MRVCSEHFIDSMGCRMLWPDEIPALKLPAPPCRYPYHHNVYL